VNYNVAVIAGTLAAPPELRDFGSGSRLMRYLITTTSEVPRHRVDVIPVVLWNPTDEAVAAELAPGVGVWAACSVQRRFSSGPAGRRSQLDLVAHVVEQREDDDSWTEAG
jgi:single-stranded DNA-binding protein